MTDVSPEDGRGCLAFWAALLALGLLGGCAGAAVHLWLGDHTPVNDWFRHIPASAILGALAVLPVLLVGYGIVLVRLAPGPGTTEERVDRVVTAVDPWPVAPTTELRQRDPRGARRSTIVRAVWAAVTVLLALIVLPESLGRAKHDGGLARLAAAGVAALTVVTLWGVLRWAFAFRGRFYNEQRAGRLPPLMLPIGGHDVAAAIFLVVWVVPWAIGL